MRDLRREDTGYFLSRAKTIALCVEILTCRLFKRIYTALLLRLKMQANWKVEYDLFYVTGKDQLEE